jgi:DNA polymerase
MRSEMPLKYWKNLPEADIISDLVTGSSSRVENMINTPERPVKPAPNNAYLRSLKRRQNEG